MKKIIIALLLVIYFSTAFASENCPGKVTVILDYPGKCDDHMAFKLESTGGNWLYALSERSDSMVLSAYVADKRINPRLVLPISGDCTSINNCQKTLYMSIHD